MKSVIIEVSKTEVVGPNKRQRVRVGEVAIVVPTLADVLEFIGAAKETGEEDGLPVYSDDKANWLQSAIVSYVKAAARNKLEPGTATVKDGLKIATNWEELTAEAERPGTGAGLKLYAEVKALFADWASKQGKSQAAVTTLVGLFNNRQALALATADTKAKVKPYYEAFAASLSEEDLEKYSRPLESILETCDSAAELDL